MRFQTPLVPARLIRRYKRFLADAVLEESGEEVVVHCPNPGAMLGLKEPDIRIWLEPNTDPRKKLNYGWRLTELPDGHWAGIDTSVPNRVVKEALLARAVPTLAEYTTVRPEVRYGRASRVDFLLSGAGLPDAWVEVKNVHLRRADDWAEFPDCVTTRGARHLEDLSEMAAQGARAVMLYLVQRTDCARLRMASDLDPGYAAAFDAARAAGVEMICHGTSIGPGGVSIGPPLPVDPSPQA
ncbi:DNA/RNA nuclease SfsA [Tropicimonas isoalkanivorans]|uniref:Sugar fermentation stimulation protein homolog n=1 Tax=Tropicimonas isoalkanivorans TaxID=441112 RepID=A0A1I1NX99_9RHOB|nr:DNA/RNA nuclease SfsA [Tropicimonas isoalkanivorans]SFD02075.1 sugar fermentation stimulation protein A [Tropicimonas isoalkanivorans]